MKPKTAIMSSATNCLRMNFALLSWGGVTYVPENLCSNIIISATASYTAARKVYSKNTCTIDNILTILTLQYCRCATFAHQIDTIAQNNLQQVLLSLSVAKTDNHCALARTVFLCNNPKVKCVTLRDTSLLIDLQGCEENFATLLLSDLLHARRRSVCSNVSCSAVIRGDAFRPFLFSVQ